MQVWKIEVKKAKYARVENASTEKSSTIVLDFSLLAFSYRPRSAMCRHTRCREWPLPYLQRTYEHNYAVLQLDICFFNVYIFYTT